MTNPTPKQAVQALAALLRQIPLAIRQWLYVALVIVAVVYIGVTAWREGLSTDQLVALAIAAYGTISRANATGK
ncbi:MULTISPECIES: hypothetical protein [unclassified Nocardioides]|uniref:hypothetical protein n=1 Tax=unclassified Nocardioides TaxID=2615069 RepID=UPI0009EF92A3|nr:MULTISPECIES: hypothetical protein [unclassified Nocardioides]GAW50629.1 Linear gramicidin synthase subunit C [Nocardioides sp. PD653-B2]GAW55528.1 Linear gramicidin synthase subunit C [Nocardioides sp. PD653]